MLLPLLLHRRQFTIAECSTTPLNSPQIQIHSHLTCPVCSWPRRTTPRRRIITTRTSCRSILTQPPTFHNTALLLRNIRNNNVICNRMDGRCRPVMLLEILAHSTGSEWNTAGSGENEWADTAQHWNENWTWSSSALARFSRPLALVKQVLWLRICTVPRTHAIMAFV